MEKLVGLKGGQDKTYFEVLEVKESIITTYPPIKDGKIVSWPEFDFEELIKLKKEITLTGHAATVTGNAVSAENAIKETLGEDYSVLAVSPTVLQIYSKSDLSEQIKLLCNNSNRLKINGAWYINNLPQHIVLELENGNLTKALMIPYRQLTDQDFSDYKGHHPRKMKGQPLPDYLYRFYGLEKNQESATEMIHVRVTQSEKTKIDVVAKNAGKNISEFVRNYIRSL